LMEFDIFIGIFLCAPRETFIVGGVRLYGL
jgi:hypothetical protein